MQEKIGPLVGGETPRETQGHDPRVQPGLGTRNHHGLRSDCGHLPADAFAGIFHQGLPVRGAHGPQSLVRNLAQIRRDGGGRPHPARFATGFRPKFVGRH